MSIKDLTASSLEKQWVKKLIEKPDEDKKNAGPEFGVLTERPQEALVKDIKQPSNLDTVVSSNQVTTKPSDHETKIPIPQHAPIVYDQGLIEKLRTIVKQLGREQATYRLTPEEKKALKSIEFEYSNKDMKTNINEIVRIAVNFILEDYRTHKERSLLNRVLESLNK